MKELVAHKERNHASMSPSSAPRWRKCKASYLASQAFPDEPSGPAAIAGTMRHEWADYALSNGETDVEDYIGTAHPKSAGNVLTREMADDVAVCLDYVYALLAPEDELYVEERLDLSRYFGNADGDGTADCTIFKPAEQHLHVIDFKFGRIEVAAENNEQLAQYALGAMNRFTGRAVARVTIHIVQPASRPAGKKWELQSVDLFDEGQQLKADVAEARSPGATFNPGEKQCMWCKVARNGACPAFRAKAEAAALSGFEAIEDMTVTGFDADKAAEALAGLELFEAYAKSVREWIDANARQNKLPRGHKWINTPGRRTWKLPEVNGDAENVLAHSVREALAWTFPGASAVEMFDRKLITPPALEKIVGKKAMAELNGLVTKTAGGFSLVPENDPRPAVEYNKSSDGFTAISE